MSAFRGRFVFNIVEKLCGCEDKFMKEALPQLKDGSDWEQHDKCIVGDEAGLVNLIKACEKAIESGEYIGSDLGDYIGVKKVATEELSKETESKATPLVLTGLFVLVAISVSLVVIGGITVWNWI